jgi:hypothetical protein
MQLTEESARMSFKNAGIAILFFVATMMGASAARGTTCTAESVKGVYGISTIGLGLNGSSQPASSVYQITADGAGNITGSATKSIDGSIVSFTFTGTYEIEPTCTGTATFTNQDDQTEHDNFVMNNTNKGAFLLQTDTNHVQSSFAVAQGTIASCTDATLAHTYSLQLSGEDVGTGQVALAGQLVLKEKKVGTVENGTLAGTVGISVNGTITPSVAVTGTYTVASNCTATATITPSGMSAMNFNFVIVEQGKEVLAIETDNNTIVTGILQE